MRLAALVRAITRRHQRSRADEQEIPADADQHERPPVVHHVAAGETQGEHADQRQNAERDDTVDPQARDQHA